MRRLFNCFLALAPMLVFSGCLKYQQVTSLAEGRLYLQLDKVDLRYADTGQPDSAKAGQVPLLFIHGFGSSLETWELVSPLLCEARRCISLDLPGFGLSSKYEGDYSHESMVSTIVALLDRLAVPQVDLVAHSYGCSVALAVAAEHPQRVRRLVISDGFTYADQMPWFFAWSRPRLLGEVLFGLFYDQQLDWRIPLSFYNRDLVGHQMVLRAYEALGQPGTRAAALAVVRGLDLAEAEQHYGTLPHKTLVIWGREDAVTPVRYGERLSQQLSRARMEMVPFSGHFPMVEAPGMYATMVGDFLNDGSAP